MKVGKEAIFAETEVKVQVFGRHELGVVPGEVFGQ